MEGSVSVDTISELSALVPTLGAIVRVPRLSRSVRLSDQVLQMVNGGDRFSERFWSKDQLYAHRFRLSWFCSHKGSEMGSYIWG